MVTAVAISATLHANAAHSLAKLLDEKLVGDDSTAFRTPAVHAAVYVAQPLKLWLGISSMLVKYWFRHVTMRAQVALP